MMKVIQEISVSRSPYRREFLGFLQNFWKYLPEYISKDDPFECSFPTESTTRLPKYWKGDKNAAGLLKYIATYIANYLNAIEMLPEEVHQKILQSRPAFDEDMISVLLSNQFTNKRFYALNKSKRKQSLTRVKVSPEIYGLNNDFNINIKQSSDPPQGYYYKLLPFHLFL